MPSEKTLHNITAVCAGLTVIFNSLTIYYLTKANSYRTSYYRRP